MGMRRKVTEIPKLYVTKKKKKDSREPMLLSWINPPSEHKFPLENELDNRAKTNKR